MKKIILLLCFLFLISYRVDAGWYYGSGAVECSADDFSDDWEDNDLADDWTGEQDADGNLDVQAAPGAGHGSYSMHHQHDTLVEARLRKTFGGDYTGEYWLQFYIYFDEVTGWGDTKYYKMMTIYDASWNEVGNLNVLSNSGGSVVQLRFNGSSTYNAVIAPSASTWYPIKLRYVKGSGSDGIVQVWFDGTLKIDISNDTRQYNTRSIDFGFKQGTATTTTLDVYFDDFRIRIDDCF